MSNSTGCVVMRKRVSSSSFSAMYDSRKSSENTPPRVRNAWSSSQAVERLLERRADVRHLLRLFRRQVVEVLVDRVARVDLVLHAVQARHQHRGEREVGVRRRIREAHFDAAAVRARHVRDAAGRRAVARRVGEVDRRLEARHQALVRVGARVGDRVQRLGVLDDAADVVQREVRQARRSRCPRTGSCRPSTPTGARACPSRCRRRPASA